MFAQINQQEITQLATKKASGLATQIYLVLASHCWKKDECFPSLKRISGLLGGVYHTNSIHRALKWLESNGFIIRKAATATNRFIMKVRSLTKRLASKPIGEHKRKQKRKNNYRYSNTSKKYKYQSKKIEPKAPSLRDIAEKWLDNAMEFVLGMTKAFDTKGNKAEIMSLLGMGHCASMYWDDIELKCSHLMI